jgi:SAM-dependent methyltransferase
MVQYDIPEKLRTVVGDAIRPGGLALTERAAAYCNFAKGDRIVDIGCGWGTTLRYLQEHHGLQVCGIDASDRLFSGNHNLPVVQADAEHLPLGDSFFDGIFCECVLSLLPSPDNALLEFHRVLHPGDWVVLSDIYLQNPDSISLNEAAIGLRPLNDRPTCLSGAVAESAWIARVKECGFELLLWEDHSAHLRELAARIVWTLGSRDGLMKLFFPRTGSVCDPEAIRRARPGYFLLIARKADKG